MTEELAQLEAAAHTHEQAAMTARSHRDAAQARLGELDAQLVQLGIKDWDQAAQRLTELRTAAEAALATARTAMDREI